MTWNVLPFDEIRGWGEGRPQSAPAGPEPVAEGRRNRPEGRFALRAPTPCTGLPLFRLVGLPAQQAVQQQDHSQ